MRIEDGALLAFILLFASAIGACAYAYLTNSPVVLAVWLLVALFVREMARGISGD